MAIIIWPYYFHTYYKSHSYPSTFHFMSILENDDRIVKFLEQKENAEKERVKAEKKAARQAEAKKQLEELARRATEEALKMAALDASGKDKDVTTLTTDDLATMTFSQNNDTNSAGSGGDGQK